jgi:hypothetical protein
MDDMSEVVIEEYDNLKMNMIAADVNMCATRHQSI